ncbi:putative toxin-antitoxin system toxin component, PIN family [Marinobacter sp.]|uniref:PIN domain-containing protein n=1 Tax=Marinobacter sp. TaxID=50741 RepID=UPI00384F7CC5
MSQDVVVDTNVFVAAGFNSRSASARILKEVESGNLRMIWDNGTRGEIEHILGKIPGLSKANADRLFRKEAHFSGKTHPERFGHVPDHTDRKFAALADASGATLISSDDDLLGSRSKAKVRILTPVEFCEKELSR